jgi:putative heme-binding domain-containing protein
MKRPKPVSGCCAGVFVLATLSLVLPDAGAPLRADEPKNAAALFDRDNLVAWCIVPFDAKKRGPEERVAMLKRLGFRHYAYDWRVEHLPTLDRELATLRREGIELTAVWFPGELNDDARRILKALERHDIKTQLWVMIADPPSQLTQPEKIDRAAATLRPIAQAAARQGCSLALYNHGGWFGEPENQVAILRKLGLSNVRLVYNLHHGHEHLSRLRDVLALMLPYLDCINLNGMTPAGDQRRQKILPLAQGAVDLEVLSSIQASGYRGRIGIIGHTDDDAEARLLDNLDGLSWLVRRMKGDDPGPLPKPRTPVPAIEPVRDSSSPSKPAPRSNPNKSSSVDNSNSDQSVRQQAIADLVAAARRSGDARRGMDVFRSARVACLSCHEIDGHGGTIGPGLSDLGRKQSAEQIAESILWSRLVVKPEYAAWQITTTDGRLIQAYMKAADHDHLELIETASGKRLTLPRGDIDEQREIGTLMPEGLLNSLGQTDRADLLRFLMEIGVTPGLADELGHAYHRQVAEFSYDRAPLNPDEWPSWRHPVNRDRLYDFYRKEALFFRQQAQRPARLPAYPGLDGGKLGHWGNQNEDVWRDGRWNETDLGTVLSGVFHASSRTIPKAVCVRLGDHGEISACFNPQSLQYEAVWRGGFLKLSDVRHGFLDGLRADGVPLPVTEDEKTKQPFVYHGFYRYGKRVLFAYRLGEREMLDAPWVEKGKFHRVVAPRDVHPLNKAVLGGPAQWPQTFKVRGKLGAHSPYAVDTIPMPLDNPWKALIFVGDHGFLSDGSAMLCTMQGDVWHVTGLDEKLQNVVWRRFASGLHQPLGLVVHNDQVYVQGRDQITRLHDLNRDGEADFYECFSNAMFTSTAGHDYIAGLARDAEGRFYTASSKEGLIRTSANGQTVDVLATGFRNPDGLSLLPNASVTVPCSEGDWTPASMICLVKKSADQTAPHEPPHFGYGGPRGGRPPELPLAYLPRGLDNSSGAQTIVPDDRWGPLAGQLLHFSFGAGAHFLVLRDEVNGVPQGAVVPLAGEFRSGAHRGKFNPIDGQLYVSGMTCWGSYTPDDGSFQRVRYTGAPVQLPKSFHVHQNGIMLEFTRPVDTDAVHRVRNHFAQVWNYRYSAGYGSPEFSPSHRTVEGHDTLSIAGVHSIDERTIFVELPDLQPVSQLHLLLQVDSGGPQELFITVHRLDAPYTALPAYRPIEKTIAAHPLAVDLALLENSKPNPWRKKLKGARLIDVAAGKNLSFTPNLLKARAGEPLKLVFTNPDEVPHNWVLVRPETLPHVGDLSNKLIADPQAVLRHYVPPSDDVLVYSDIVPPLQSFEIYFNAPSAPGQYPFLCTFPGHWMVMNGQLVVE